MGDDLIKAAGLWKKTSAKGKPYLVGRMGGVRVLILGNTKRSDKDPDYNLVFTPFEDKRPAKAEPAEPPADEGGT